MILNRPHPFIFNTISVLAPGVVAFLVIILMAPFDFNDMSFLERLGFGALFGVIASLCVLVVLYVLKKMFLTQKMEESWSIGKELLLIFSVLTLICLVNFCVVLFLGLSSDAVWRIFFVVVVYTFLISIFPIVIMVLTEQVVHQQSKLKEASILTDKLDKKAAVSKTDEVGSSKSKLSLIGENGNTEIELESKQVLYLRSDGNYVEVFFWDGQLPVKKKLIRNRLKYFADYLPIEDFFQCHKSYIVNKRNIQSVTGNARNFELLLRDSSSRIPVSRNKTSELKNLFQS